MNPWGWLEDAERGTWGAFVRHARQFDVDVEWIPEHKFADADFDGCYYLIRRAPDGEVLFFPMVRDCTPATNMRWRRMVDACKRLGIPESPNWPIDF